MATEPMTTAGVLEVINAIKVVATVSRTVSSDDLAAFIEQAAREDAFGPFVDPTTWMRAHGRDASWVRAARALLAFQREMQTVSDELAGVTDHTDDAGAARVVGVECQSERGTPS